MSSSSEFEQPVTNPAYAEWGLRSLEHDALVDADPAAIEEERRLPTALRRLLRSRLAIASLVVIGCLILFSYLGPVFWGISPDQTDPSGILAAPSAAHPLGTDDVGRDVLARLMAGGQTTFEVAILAALLASALGVIYGAIAGYAGGALDAAMMRFVDMVLSIPVLVLLIFLAAALRPTPVLLIFVIGLTSWLVPARLVRAETISVGKKDFVRAARSMGSPAWWIIRRHILPNAIGTIVVNSTFQVADAVLLIAYLSFLGLGIPPPAPTWGGTLFEGITYIYQDPWWLIYSPALVIILTVISFNYFGDATRDALDLRFERNR